MKSRLGIIIIFLPLFLFLWRDIHPSQKFPLFRGFVHWTERSLWRWKWIFPFACEAFSLSQKSGSFTLKSSFQLNFMTYGRITEECLFFSVAHPIDGSGSWARNGLFFARRRRKKPTRPDEVKETAEDQQQDEDLPYSGGSDRQSSLWCR